MNLEQNSRNLLKAARLEQSAIEKIFIERGEQCYCGEEENDPHCLLCRISKVLLLLGGCSSRTDHICSYDEAERLMHERLELLDEADRRRPVW